MLKECVENGSLGKRLCCSTKVLDILNEPILSR